MAGSLFNDVFKVTTFGESHGVALGCVIDGCPAGIELSEEDVQIYLDRRRPGQSDVSTERDEKDKVQILSGVFEGRTTGTPIAMVAFNTDQQSKDYSNIKDIFRPAHGDFTYEAKYGYRDYRGGGRASGRETLTRVMAGAVAIKILEKKGIEIYAYTKSIKDIQAKDCDFDFIEKNIVRTCCAKNAEAMEKLIVDAKAGDDSVGGVIECQVLNLPAGLGSPVFDKFEARLASAMMSIGSTKGFEIGSGFDSTTMFGSEHNDNITGMKNGRLEFEKNYCGGVLAGITTGSPLVFRTAFKPTSSIKREQIGITRDGELKNFILDGRHDPCIVPRAVPVVQAMTALVIVDELLRSVQ
jgi:chorismate synthase